MKRIYLSLCMSLATLGLLGSAGSLDVSFDGDGYNLSIIDGIHDNQFQSVAVQSDGKIVAVGYIRIDNSRSSVIVVRYLSNGLLDTVVNGGSGFGDIVDDLQVGYAIKIFTEDAWNQANSVALQSDGKIVITGYTGYPNRYLFVARYTTTGVLDISSADGNIPFNGALGYTVFLQDTNGSSVAIQPDGKIVISGDSQSISQILIVRYTSAGILDTSSADGNVRFNSTGYLLTNLPVAGGGYTPIAIGSSVAIQSDGKIVVAGYSNQNDVQSQRAFITVVRCTNAGALDTSVIGGNIPFGGSNGYVVTRIGDVSNAYSVAIQSDQKIVIGGSINGSFSLIRYLSNGLLDTVANSGSGFGDSTAGVQTGIVRFVGSGYGVETCWGIAIQADQKIVGIGRNGNNGNIVVARYTTTGILDTSFNTIGYTETAIPNTSYTLLYGVAIQTDQKIVIAGYGTSTSSSLNELLVARYIGEGSALTSGMIDTAYGTDGANDLNVTLEFSAGQAKSINVITVGDQAGKMLIADSNGTDTTIAMLDATGIVSDTDAFGTGVSSVALSGVAQTQAIMVDFTGLIFYILGTDGKVRSLTYGSSTITTFATSLVTTAYAITQQASGRILVAGKNVSNQGLIVAYTPDGVIDISFNSTATFNASPNNILGYWNIDLTNPVTAVSVGATSNNQSDADKIFFAYDNYDGNAEVARLLANGSALDSDFTFGTPIASVIDATQIKMQLDINGKIVLVTNTGGAAGIKAARYNVDGTNDIVAATIIANTSDQRLENILTLSDGTTLILAAVPNVTASLAFMNLARLTSGFALDTENFNAEGDIPGILSTNVPSSDFTPVMTDFYALDVIVAGGILISGDNSQTASSAHPYLAQVVNTDIVTKVSQSAAAFGVPGELDTTFNPAGTDAGFMNLNSELQVAGFPTATVAKVLCQYDNGIYYIAGDDGTNTYITQMSPDDIQTEGWGNTTPTLDGLLTLTGKANVAGMMFLQSGSLIAIGGAGSSGSKAGWAQQFSPADGALNVTFNLTTTLDAHYAITQQSNGRILVAGGNAGIGTIIAFNSETGAVDTTFATNGIYTATGYGAINSILVDASDNIYCVVNDTSSNAKVIKLVASGSGIYLGWTVPTITANSSIAANNHLAFDQTGKILATAVNTTSNVTNVMLYVASNGTLSASLGLANVSGSGNFATGITVPNITSIFVDMNTSPGKVILTGFDSNTTPAVPFIIRTNTAIAIGPDTTFNADGVYPGVQKYNTLTSGVATNWYAGMINADGKITVAGYASVLTTPYLMRVYGTEFIGQYVPSVDAGIPGTIDTNFGNDGQIDFLALFAALPYPANYVGATPVAVLPMPDGSQYVAFDVPSPASYSFIARFTNGNILDTSYGTGGISSSANYGVNTMMMDGSGRLLIACNFRNGWVVRYLAGNSGGIDISFPDSSGLPVPGSGNKTILQQSMGRYVITGATSENYGALFAFNESGVADTTFAVGSTSGTGVYDTGVVTTVYAIVADQYDRLILAYKNGTNVDIRRLTSSGEIDITFGVDGTISGAFISGIVDDATQVRVILDAAGDIVIATHLATAAIAIITYDNITGNVVAPGQLNLPSLVTPILTNLIATADGNVLVSGNNTTTPFDMWVARITSLGVLDTDTFNPDGTAGVVHGIMQFAADLAETPTARNSKSIAMYGDGQISMVGSETSSSGTIINPFMSRAYCNPYTTQEPVDLTSQAPGTNDLTFGVGIEPNYVENGISFYAITGGINQTARAAVMQNGNANGVVVALDGKSTSNTLNSYIYLNMFDVDGLLNTDFVQVSAPDNIDPGQMLVLSMFDQQYVNDMLTFTVDGISKAILAGYAYNTALNTNASLLMQCVLTPNNPGLDSSFGGLNNNSLGVAFGDGRQLNTVGLQSTGRIITGGYDQDFNGLLLGYTPAGNLDQSFGQGGTFIQGATGIYTSAIDSFDRLVVAYNVGGTLTIARILADGSGLDETFADNGILSTTITTVFSNNRLRLAIDGLGNIVVVTVLTDEASFSIARYTSAGILSGDVATLIGSDFGSLIHLDITKLLIDSNNAVVVVGSDLVDITSQLFVVRCVYLSTEYILDETFNSDNTPGYIKYTIGGGDLGRSYGAFIHPDGRIIISGSYNPVIIPA